MGLGENSEKEEEFKLLMTDPLLKSFSSGSCHFVYLRENGEVFVCGSNLCIIQTLAFQFFNKKPKKKKMDR